MKKTLLEAYSRPRQNGVNAITIKEGDQLLEAVLTSGHSEVIIAAKNGKAIRFNEEVVRPIGRTGAGVKGITIDDDDEVVTEELAEIYLAQGLRDKSVAIYRKLSLRNPEKSVYFAELIGKIENNIKI